ncbi:hypothetical protein Pelo_13176 [Pelomyxa schiedti]|nr:hypothetical protein Pelo_16266 [Pelomyxa schiedti]KAH3745427.1 hypothetical protein Pelo_13176 [Pelomyxa schiedti]
MGNVAAYSEARRELHNDVAAINCMGVGFFFERVQVLFTKYDVNHNGTLEWNEAKHFLADVGKECRINMTDDKSRLLFEQCDTNHDGVLSLGEFKKLALSAGVKAPPGRS